MAKDVNGKELKVGDKVRALTNGGYGNEFVVGGVYEVTALSEVSNKGVKIGCMKLFMCSHEIRLVEEATTKGSDMFKFKVGDKLVLKEEGVTSGTGYDNEQLARLEVYGFIEVMDVGVGSVLDGYAVAMQGNYWALNKLWLSKEDLEDYYVLKQDCRLTPKLIESLDELKVGDYFRTKYGEVINVMSVDKSCYYPIATDAYAYNLAELQGMGAYKVKVEPLEMVEVEEVKPKLYELVEGQNYVKLEIGDVVKFANGNTHGVHAVDDDAHPYCMYFMGDSWWIEARYFLPENIISINGVNIHEEYVGDAEITADPYGGWVVGAKVRCLETEGNGSSCDYIKGKIYCIGFDDDYPKVVGVVHPKGNVFRFGMITEDGEFVGEAYKHFELVKE